MITRTLLFLLIAVPAMAQTPIDFKKWKSGEVYTARMGGELSNYPEIAGSDTTWAVINNSFTTTPDSAYNFTDIIKTTVLPKGTSRVTVTWGGVDYTITQRPRKLIWINTTTFANTDVTDTASWPSPTISDSVVEWSGVIPGVDYSIHKSNATLQHRIHFKPGFLDSAVTLYDQRADSLQIALGNVMEYTLSTNIDSFDVDLGSLPKRVLKKFGKYGFELTEQYVQGFPIADSVRLPVKQYWKAQGEKMYCVEYVMMRRLKQIHEAYPSATIWHNDEVTLKDDPNVFDTYIWEGNAEFAYTGTTPLFNRIQASSDIRTLMSVQGVAAALGAGATISSAICSLNVSGSGGGDDELKAYRVFKNWNSDGLQDASSCVGQEYAVPTWVDWSCQANEWTTVGCDNADDGGSDNSGDGTGADRKATEDATIDVGSTGWKTWTIPTALAQGWYDEDFNENGHIFISQNTGLTQIVSTDGTAADRPRYIFTYTVGGAPTMNIGAGNFGEGIIGQ